MLRPIILKNVDFPAMFVPVKTIPLFSKLIELGTASLINGCTPSTILIPTLSTNLGLVYFPFISSL